MFAELICFLGLIVKTVLKDDQTLFFTRADNKLSVVVCSGWMKDELLEQ